MSVKTVIAALSALAVASAVPARADESVTRAQTFLRTAQLPGGTYGGVPILDAAEAAAVLDVPAYRDAAVFALAQAVPDNTEAALARLDVLVGGPWEDPVAAEAVLRAAAAGDLGLAPGWRDSDPLVLARALRFAARIPVPVMVRLVDEITFAASETSLYPAVFARLVGQLAAIQRVDGGFGFADEPSDVAVTAEVARALSAAVAADPSAAPLLASARLWLTGQTPSASSLPAADLALLLLGGELSSGVATAVADFLRTRQDASGGFDGDVRATALAIRGLAKTLPNLAIELSALTPKQVGVGQDLVVPVRVRNTSAIDAQETTLEFQLIEAGGGVARTGTLAVAAVAAGATVGVTVTLSAPATTGNDVLQLVVNPGGTFRETTYDDNVLRAAVRVTPPPDLVIEPMDISMLQDPPVVYQATRVSVRVRNVGEALAENVHVQLFEGLPASGGVLLGETVLNAVGPGTPRVLDVMYTPRDVKPVTLYARVDPAGAILEVDEGNNAATRTVTPVLPAEYQVDTGVHSIMPGTGAKIAQGQPVKVEYLLFADFKRFSQPHAFVGVRAGWPIRSFPAVLYQELPGGSLLEVQRVTANLDAEYASDMSRILVGYFTYALPVDAPAGVYRFRVVVDPDHTVSDVNLSNNALSMEFELTNADVAELMFEPGSVQIDPPIVDAANPATVRARVRNIGKATALSIPVQIAAPGRTITRTIAALGSGEAYDIAEPLTFADATPGGYITLTIDPANLIAESTKTNNTATTQVTLSSYAVAIESLSITPDPAPGGGLATLTLQARNVGHADVTLLQIRATEGACWLVDRAVWQTVRVGELATIELPLSLANVTLGDKEVRVEVQPLAPGTGPAVTARTPMSVRRPDLAVASRGIELERTFGSAGEELLVPVITIDNLGDLPATASVRLYRGYASMADPVAIGTIAVAAHGATIFRGSAFAPPAAPPHVVTAILDEENAVPELDETNNVATRPVEKNLGDVIVAFDETHGPGSTVGATPDAQIGSAAGDHSDWARDLKARGYVVTTLEPGANGFTPAKLRGVDVLVGPTSIVPLSASEQGLLADFVQSGGGYFLMGEWGSTSITVRWKAWQDSVGTIFGLEQASSGLARGGSCTGSCQMFVRWEAHILPHPITDGVERIHGALTGGFSRIPAGATVLVKSGPDWQSSPDVPVVGVLDFGRGRVGFTGEGTMADASIADCGVIAGCGLLSPYYEPGNRRLLAQMIDWLANGGPAEFPPDLAFTPPSLVLSNATPIAGESVRVSATVRNVGGATRALGPTKVRFHDGSAGTGAVLAEVDVPALPIDQGYDVVFDWDTTLAAGDHVITAVVDPDGLIEEYSETNNTISAAVQVRSAVDLRIDPSDISLQPGTPPTATVRVHNLGHAASAAGTPLRLRVLEGAATVATVALPVIPARASVVVSAPWPTEFPPFAFTLEAVADPDGTVIDPDRSNNVARFDVLPPSLEVQTPLEGTVWGGSKTVRWNAKSETRPRLDTFVAMGRPGGSFTTLGRGAGSFDLNTAAYADGEWILRVTTSDGLQSARREIPITISNNGAAVRTFAGAATWSASAPGGSASVRIPVDCRVDAATVVLDVDGSSGAMVAPTWPQDPTGGSLIEFRGRLHHVYLKIGALYEQVSDDDGATWSAAVQLSPPGVNVYSHSESANSFGIHQVYSLYETPSRLYARRNPDGRGWSSPFLLGTWDSSYDLHVTASDDGLALGSASGGLLFVAVADAKGDTWGPVARFVVPDITSPVVALVSGAQLHLVTHAGNGAAATLDYRRSPAASYVDFATYAPPVALDTGVATNLWADASDGDLALAWRTSAGLLRTQRCPSSASCTARDAWLPSPLSLNEPTGGAASLYAHAADRARAAWIYGGKAYTATAIRSGAQWSEASELDVSLASPGASLVARSYLAQIGNINSGYNFVRSPRLTPRDQGVDVGADGSMEVSRPGIPGVAFQSGSLAESLNAYLAAHGDGDDGALDGFIGVPLRVVGSGAGGSTLRNLEVRYRPLTAVAGFAEPRLFSPGSSPGVLDTTVLSLRAQGEIVISSSAGVTVRTLAVAPAGARQSATFDGRSDSGEVLPSGVYAVIQAGTPVADVEIDDIPPTARLDVDGALGGAAAIRGVATDRDFAGTARNFARYLLEYSRDGQTYTAVSAGSTPVAEGVLGTLNTNGLPAGPVTLRLTAWDRAGNSSTAQRDVSTDPNAPAAPRIDTPTAPGTPLDSVTPTVTVAGTADAGTTVTVFVNGVAAATASSTGRWAVSGLSLPVGIVTITANSTRSGVTGPTSEPIVVARYALTVRIEAPDRAAAGASLTGTIRVSRTSVSTTPLVVRLSAVDSTGASANLGLAPAETAVSAPAAGEASFPFTTSAGARAGTYTLVAEVVAGGKAPAGARHRVVLDPERMVAATLASDKATYGALQLVALEARVSNIGTGSTGPLFATMEVVAPTARSHALGPYPIASVMPGGVVRVGALYGTPPLDVGVHAASLVVADEFGNVLATSETSFDVRAGAGADAFAGTIVVEPATFSPGQPLDASWTVRDTGAGGEADVSLLVVRASDGLVFDRHDEHLSIAAGGTVAASSTLSTATADRSDLLVVLLANGKGLAAQSVTYDLTAPDTAPPVILIDGFDPGELRSTSVTAVVTVTDESAFTATMALNDDPFWVTTTARADGDYLVAVSAIDASGNATTAARSFAIDATPPAISVTGVADGELTSATVLPIVTVTDAHLATQRLELDGVEWDGLPISSEGSHVFSSFAQDLAGNASAQVVQFTIDRTPPTIVVSGVDAGAIYGAAVTPVITVVDAGPGAAAWTATLNDAPWHGGEVGEGAWTLLVSASDAAGIAAIPVALAFAVDLTAPIIDVAGITDGLLTRAAVRPVVTITDANPATSTVLLDDDPFLPGTIVTREGEHVLTASATDAAGHAAAPVRVAFTIDTTPPAITVRGVTDGGTYYVDATPEYVISDAHPDPSSDSARLDGTGVPFVSGTKVGTPGPHTLVVSSTDGAGNFASKTIRFTVVAVQATLTGSLDQSPRVIVVVNCAGQPAGCETTQARVLFAALAGAGIPFDYALDGATFLAKVRQNRHNVRVLYRSGSAATNSYWELRELTFEGGGLVAVNDASPDSDPKIKETEGVSMLGNIGSVGAVSIAAGDLGPARTITISGPGITQRVDSVTGTAVGKAGRSVVLSTNRYGLGRAVTLTFNPEANGNDTVAIRDLLAQAVRFAAGGSLVGGVPGAPQYVRFQSSLTSPAGPINMQLAGWVGTGLVPISDTGTPLASPVTWGFPLASGSPVTRSMGVSAGQAGRFTVGGDLAVVDDGGAPRSVATAHVDVEVTGSIAELRLNAIASIDLIPSGLSDTARANARAHVVAVNPSPESQTVCSDSITQALEATDDLKLISGTAAVNARAKVDQLLRALQALYPTLP